MWEGLPLEWLGALTPGALLGACVAAIIAGRLIPLKTHKREIEVRDKQIEYLRQALEVYQEDSRRRALQVHELLEHSRMTTAIVRSLPHAEESTPT